MTRVNLDKSEVRRWIFPAAALLYPLLATTLTTATHAQNLRADFRQGRTAPDGWHLSGGTGKWETDGPGAARSVSVTGAGEDMNYWRSGVPGLKPDSAYRIRFLARVLPGSSTTTVISGLDVCNRDFSATPEWQPYTFVFTTPDDITTAFVRLGQWHLKGTVAFGAVSLAPVVPVYKKQGALVLGEGEQMNGSAYTFTAPPAGEGSNSARALASHTAAFNSDRWVFGGNSEVIYRHNAGGSIQQAGRVTVSVGYHTSGDCIVSASRDGRTWTEAARISGIETRTIALPSSLFPASVVWIRLKGGSATGAAGNSEPGAFQVTGYRYHADLATSSRSLSGSTRFLEVERQDGRVAVQVDDVGELTGQSALHVVITAAKTFHAPVVVSLRLSGKDGASPYCQSVRTVALRPGFPTPISIRYRTSRTGAVRLRLDIHPEGDAGAGYLAEMDSFVPDYFAGDYGYALTQMPEGTLWWCEGAYKVSPARPAPELRRSVNKAEEEVRISAAGRERIAFQLVLAAVHASRSIRIRAGDLLGPGGARIPSSNVQVREVGYVPVRVPTDKIGVAAEWPDPLPPLSGNGLWHPKPDRNNPLWITVTVPADTRPGDYVGSIALEGAQRQNVPVHLHVRGFSLPERTELRSGFGISPDSIRRFHNLADRTALRKEWDLYMRDFAAHRLAPYNPMALAPIQVELAKEPTLHVVIDFSEFDRAARGYLDELRFTGFRLGVLGMGSGRYPNYDQGSLFGYPAGTSEYDTLMTDYGRQMQDHLERNGWLNKAYAYWYDEPETSDYPFVVRGMDRLKRYFPKLKRMLTEEFHGPLYGSVDLWCPITPEFAAESSLAPARQSKGEEVWWYVCTGPKEPYCALFIDHPAIEMRMWLWQTWKYHVQGILIWETTWWTSPGQFKTALQNCWEDPMSYTDQASGMWGNGDGRFFYPPNRRPNEDPSIPFTGAPIDSLRWEMLGEGVQDWEYFHLLDTLVRNAEEGGEQSTVVRQAKQLLTIPDSICRDMTHFTTDPQPLYHYRERVANAIEAMLHSTRRQRSR